MTKNSSILIINENDVNMSNLEQTIEGEAADENIPLINEPSKNAPTISPEISSSPTLPIKKPSKRLYWVDCLRVFASYLVIFIHCNNVYLKPPPDFREHNGRIIITYCALTRPCVPLFIMISGIFFLNPEKKNITLKNIYTKYIVRLLKSFLFWTIYYGIFDRYVINPNQIQYTFSKKLVIDTLKKCFIRGEGHLWYISLTIGLYMVTPIYRLVTADRKIAWYTAILCSIFSQLFVTIYDFGTIVLRWDLNFLKTAVDSLYLNTAGNYLCYFLFGYLIGTHNFSKKRYIYLSYLVGILGSILTVVLRFTACKIKNKTVHDLSRYQHFDVVMATYGIFVFFKYTVNRFVEPLMEKNFFKKCLSTLSECSFGVYLLHLTFYHIFYRLNFHSQTFNPLYWTFIYAGIIYSVCFVLVFYLRKFKFFREIM